MFDTMPELNYDNLRIIGCGIDNVVLTDGHYAIKVGSFRRDDIRRLEKAAHYGLAVPVFYAEKNSIIDSRIVQLLLTSPIYRAGNKVSHNAFIEKKNDVYVADISIFGLAHPLIDNTIDSVYTYDARVHAADRVNALRKKAQQYRIFWSDPHVYNIGIYNDQDVILDF